MARQRAPRSHVCYSVRREPSGGHARIGSTKVARGSPWAALALAVGTAEEGDDMKKSLAATVVVGLVLLGCTTAPPVSPKVPSEPDLVEKPASIIVRETVFIEKQVTRLVREMVPVEKEVTRLVKETVLVEKEVTRLVKETVLVERVVTATPLPRPVVKSLGVLKVNHWVFEITEVRSDPGLDDSRQVVAILGYLTNEGRETDTFTGGRLQLEDSKGRTYEHDWGFYGEEYGAERCAHVNPEAKCYTVEVFDVPSSENTFTIIPGSLVKRWSGNISFTLE